ncbi:LrgB-like family-domain-containing protein [Calycina marina]|uniref:LrgB-like family-domain-containing protein n=1 Tax=Calycina marina TaxID=1763456 RepID=A0A9P8CDJ4_9HELO|nr:LrgB-like family-domain-containing protein [Calycina marina]
MAEGASLLNDGLETLRIIGRLSWQRNLTAWLYVPTGILVVLLTCFGVNSLITLSSVSFPASVALLICLFFALILCDLVIGDRKTRKLVNLIDVPAGFTLRYISLFFTPSFVLLPLSPPIGGVEVAKIIAVFLIGFTFMLAATAYIVRGLQLLLGSSKKAIHERAEEMGNEADDIPLTDRARTCSDTTLVNETNAPGTANFQLALDDSLNDLIAPQRTQDPSLARRSGGPPIQDITAAVQTAARPVSQDPLQLTRPQRWAFFINTNTDRITYTIIFLFIGLPIYYSTGYAMPLHLTLNILAYFFAIALPPSFKQFLHPVLASSLITVLAIWVLGLIRGDSLHTTLSAYKTSTTYLSLFRPHQTVPLPGAGDIFSSVLDASIVALALPMYNYRLELKRHFFAIVIPNVVISIASLFGYPAICYAIGISSTRSLAFSARSLTLALAIPAVDNLGGDGNTVAAIAIMSGILGVLIGPWMLKKLRIPEDDYVTRGVTLGGNSSAIATALLLVSDPRAAALSSLSMSLFGIITLTLTSLPPIVEAVQSLVNL